MDDDLNIDLDAPVSQQAFARMVGVSEARVSQLIAEGLLDRRATARHWLMCYLGRLREMAAARRGRPLDAP